jgi:flagellar hook assembly protein FlgD
VSSVLDGVFPAGSHSFTWDGKDIDGNDVTQGVYFCRFSAGDALEVRKIVALR